MQIEDHTVLGWIGAAAAAAAASTAWGARILWGAFSKLWDSEAGCQKRLARLEGVMALQAKYERRKDLREAMVEASKGRAENGPPARNGGKRGSDK